MSSTIQVESVLCEQCPTSRPLASYRFQKKGASLAAFTIHERHIIIGLTFGCHVAHGIGPAMSTLAGKAAGCICTLSVPA